MVPTYCMVKYECFLSEFLICSCQHNVTGTGRRTTGVITKALCTLCSQAKNDVRPC